MKQESAINQLAKGLAQLSIELKSRNHNSTSVETLCANMFNALFGWNLRNLNQERGGFPGIDLGDEVHRIAIQVTVQDQAKKATHTLDQIESAELRQRFQCFICFFFGDKAPGSKSRDPEDFHRWSIPDLIKGVLDHGRIPAWLEPHVPSTHHLITLERLYEAVRIVEETLGRLPPVGPKPNNLPFGRNSHFGQRQEEMAKLEAALEQEGGVVALTQPQVVHGLGGVGKTQLAIQYAWDHEQSFTALLWLPADSESSIATGLARLCEVLDLPEKAEREDSVRTEAVRRWLRMRSGWLLIADNADTPEAQAALLREMRDWHHGRVIITSRLEDWSLQSAAIPLGTWTDMQGAQWLMARLADKPIACPEPDACALSHELGGLPLALEQAAAYMVQRRIGPAEYLNRFRASAEAAHQLLATAIPHGGGTDYEKTVATTWLVTLDQITLLARAILKMIAWLGPDEIPRFLFTRAPHQVVEAASEALVSETPSVPEETASTNPTEAVEEALVLLARYSLIELREDHLTCHRLVQSTQRWEEPQPGLLSTIRWVNAAIPNDPPPRDIRSWPLIWQPLQKPLENLVSHTESGCFELLPSDASQAGWTRLLNGLGLFLLEKAELAKTESLFHRALQIDEASFGPRHPNVAVRLTSLASLLLEVNRLAEAEPLLRRALEIDEAVYGPAHSTVGRDLNNLSGLLYATNKLSEAEPLMRRALKIGEANDGPRHPDVAIRLNNLAQLLKTTNRLAEAEPLMRRVLEIDEEIYGSQHPRVATDLNNFASLLQATNRLAQAEPLKRRALQIDEACYGCEHPKVARDLSNLALLLRDTNRQTEAEPLMCRALEIDEASFGPEHPKVAGDLSNLASLFQATNRLEAAEPLMRRALNIDEATYGPTHPSVAADLANLAGLLQELNQLEAAEPLMLRALVIDEASYGSRHPRVATNLNNLAILLRTTNRVERAESLMRRVLSIDENSYGLLHSDVARDLNNLAEILRDTNRLAEAETLMSRALGIVVRSFGMEHPKAQTVLENYSSLLAEQKLTPKEIEKRVQEVLAEAGKK
jgi:tetratricopeptide (TPR) repeat protein